MPPSPSSPVHQPSRGQLPQCPQPALQRRRRRRRRTLQQTQFIPFQMVMPIDDPPNILDLLLPPTPPLPPKVVLVLVQCVNNPFHGTNSNIMPPIVKKGAKNPSSTTRTTPTPTTFDVGWMASNPNSHTHHTTPHEATTTTVNCVASKACTMGSEPMPWPLPATEGMDDTPVTHPSNSIHGIESQRQVSEASPKIPSLRLLSWPPPPPLLVCTTTHMIYPQNTMTTGTDQPLPPGLFLYPNYITQEEEQQLLNLLDDPLAVPRWKASRFNGQSHGKRWGVHCNLRDRRVDSPEHALPSVLMETIVHPHRWDRLSCWWGNQKNKRPIPTTRNSSSSPSLTVLRPNEANAIDHRKSRGDWLQAHVADRKLSKEPIANLSLAGHCFMTYRRTGTGTNKSAAKAAAGAVETRDVYKVWLPPRVVFKFLQDRYDTIIPTKLLIGICSRSDASPLPFENRP